MAGLRLVKVKNTFIELSDGQPTEFALARQLSDPSPTRSRFQEGDFLDLASLSDPDEDLAGRDPGSQESTGGSCSDAPAGKQDAEEMNLAVLTIKSEQEQGAHVARVALERHLEQPQGQQWQGGQTGRRAGKSGAQWAQSHHEDRRSRPPPQWEGATTVMMRNLPNKYKQQMLLDEIAYHGFQAQKDFDFFYLPMDHNAKANLGYCFINFCEPATAWAFGQAFEGKKMRHFHSNKVVVVMPASMQGFERNYAYYATSRVAQAEDPQYRPLFFRQPNNERADGEALQNQSNSHGFNGKGAGGKGARSDRQQNGRERRGKRSDAANGGGGDNSRLDALHAVGNKVLYGTQNWQGADGRYADNGGYSHRRSMSAQCHSCGGEVAPSERFCAHCAGFSGQTSPQSGVWSPEGMIYAGEMMMGMPGQPQQILYREGMQPQNTAHFAPMQEVASKGELCDASQQGAYMQEMDYGRQMVLSYMDQESGLYEADGVNMAVAPR